MKQDDGNHAATPGPWIDGAPNLMDGPVTKSGSHVIYSGTREIARVYGDKGLPVKANAKLIAAAPELLEALEFLFKAMDDGWLVRDISHDAEPDWAIKAMSFVQGLKRGHTAIAKAKEG